MSFELTIVTPQGEAFRGDVENVVLPGSEGEFGVLERHERFLTALKVGEVRIHTGSEELHAAIAGGFADVAADQVAVLVESCELSHHIDVARAELAHTRAEQDLDDLDPEDTRRRDFEAALDRARNRLLVAERKARS